MVVDTPVSVPEPVPEPPVEELPCNTTSPKVSLSGEILFDRLLENISQYEIDGSILIPEGVTLIIEQCTVIQGGIIDVLGKLKVMGSELRPVIFNNVIIKSGTSYNASLEISYAKFNGGGFDTGNRINSLILQDSILKNTTQLDIWGPEANAYVERNVFLNAGGVRPGSLGWEQTFIRNNYFYNPTTEFAIKNEYTGSYDYPIIAEYNSFVNISKYAMAVEGVYTAMTAYNNYWGTNDINIIEGLIYDLNDDSNATYIPFNPYLAEHHVDTPVPVDADNNGIPDIINECLK